MFCDGIVPHLVVQPIIQWTREDGTVINTSSSVGTSQQLNFNSLQLSDGDKYTCTSSIDFTNIAISFSKAISTDIIVTSKVV